MTAVATTAEYSAGGVLWRRGGKGVEVCLISTKNGSRWQLPKGHAATGEEDASAARRETREETGCDGEVEEDLGHIAFWFFAGDGPERRRVKKTVRFYLLRYTGGDTSAHDGEVDDARWFDGDEALRVITFGSERDVLVKALERLRAR